MFLEPIYWILSVDFVTGHFHYFVKSFKIMNLHILHYNWLENIVATVIEILDLPCTDKYLSIFSL